MIIIPVDGLQISLICDIVSYDCPRLPDYVPDLPDRPVAAARPTGATLLATPAIAQDRLQVVTTFTVIAGHGPQRRGRRGRRGVDHQAGAEIHGYEPTPGDILRAKTPT
jgi:hypothetical protein